MLPKVCRMNHKNFVFALLKTIQNQAGRNSERILRLFNCNDRVFFAIAGGAKAKFLLTLVSPIRVCPKTLKKRFGLNIKLFSLRALKFSKNKLDDIVNIFCN